MAMELENVVPFGRSLQEYRALFQLQDHDLDKRILSAADGPASFNAEMRRMGHRVYSVDPLYLFEANQIHDQFYRVVDNIIQQVKSSTEDWVWKFHASPDALRHTRVEALEKFLADFGLGRKEGRYIPARLPVLPFQDNSFDLALCSHFLFLYSDHLSRDFHLRSIRELLRVAHEARLFPLLTLEQKVSPYVDFIMRKMEQEGYVVCLQQVGYELQRGADHMLVITAR